MRSTPLYPLVCLALSACAPAPVLPEADPAPYRQEPVDARPAPAFGECEKGRRNPSGVVLECGAHAIFYGDSSPAIDAGALRERVDRDLREKLGEGYESTHEPWTYGKESVPSLVYRRVEPRTKRVELVGRYVFMSEPRGARAIMCAGAEGTEDLCERELFDLALGGVPEALEPEREPEGILPRFHGHTMIVPKGCRAEPNEIVCEDELLSWVEISSEQPAGFESTYADNLAEGLAEGSPGEVRREKVECELFGELARCERLTTKKARMWFVRTGPTSPRGVVVCASKRTKRRVPRVCENVLKLL